MKSNILLVLFLLFLSISCQREWDNPFDKNCPLEIFTPSDFSVTQVGDSVVLNWNQPNNQISGFVIEKNSMGGNWSQLFKIDKTNLTIADRNIEGGIKYGYRVYAYAGNNLSNTLSEEIIPVLKAQISTTSITDISASTVTIGCNISRNGGSAVTVSGVCYDTNQNPTIDNNKTTDGGGIGSFTSNITGLTANTYYVRAYATNAAGTSYGNEVRIPFYLNFTGPEVTDVDGNTYKSVRIGDQIWMARNLKVTKYRDGTAIPNVTNDNTWANLAGGAYCDWYNDATNGAIYGHLYNYYTVVDDRQLCPTGWHVPTSVEWTTLINFLGGYNVAGGKLKKTGTTHWDSPNTGANNLSGFTALAGSWRGIWWTASEHDNNNGIYDYLDYAKNSVEQSYDEFYFGKKGGCSVRCIKD
jgi:uncharacterized protein (TIGR02145 family)